MQFRTQLASLHLRSLSDPADHFLAASAKAFGLTLITSDRNLIRTKEISVMKN